MLTYIFPNGVVKRCYVVQSVNVIHISVQCTHGKTTQLSQPSHMILSKSRMVVCVSYDLIWAYHFYWYLNQCAPSWKMLLAVINFAASIQQQMKATRQALFSLSKPQKLFLYSISTNSPTNSPLPLLYFYADLFYFHSKANV